MARLVKRMDYIRALIGANMKSYAPDKKRLLIMSLFMMIQNSMFFAFWVILFGSVKELRGWRLEELARMYGLVASAVGLSLFFCNGARSIAYRIQDGTLDSFIAKPRHVLPALLLSSSSPASLGDIFYGPLLWACFANLTFTEVITLSFLTLNAAVLFTALTVILFSISFWLKNNVRFPDQMFEVLVMMTSNIVHGQPLAVRVVLFTVIPTAFVNYLPVEIVRTFDPVLLAVVIVASLFYGYLAIITFNAGLRRYVNSLN
ncbi:MAG: ABC-2 family transporter protein [Alphaproteobacteria bacterium]|nr:ABC-2 family transporter protein [Alphaproteobacteria bacterium]